MPKRFYELYNNITIDVAKHQTISENTTVLAFERNGGMSANYLKNGSNYTIGPHQSLPEDLQRTLRRGYYVRAYGAYDLCNCVGEKPIFFFSSSFTIPAWPYFEVAVYLAV